MYNIIKNPITGKDHSIFSIEGKQLLKQYVKIINGGIAVDDRGSVRFINDFEFKGVKRFYHVDNHKRGFIRAWHGHKKEGKYVYVVDGAALIGLVNMKTKEI